MKKWNLKHGLFGVVVCFNMSGKPLEYKPEASIKPTKIITQLESTEATFSRHPFSKSRASSATLIIQETELNASTHSTHLINELLLKVPGLTMTMKLPMFPLPLPKNSVDISTTEEDRDGIHIITDWFYNSETMTLYITQNNVIPNSHVVNGSKSDKPFSVRHAGVQIITDPYMNSISYIFGTQGSAWATQRNDGTFEINDLGKADFAIHADFDKTSTN